MHLALPTRKNSNPPAYVPKRSPRNLLLRRSRLQKYLICACAAGILIYLLSQLFRGSDSVDSGLLLSSKGSPPVVIVTVIDNKNRNQEYIRGIKDNRESYAKRYGYSTFFPNVSDYKLDGAPASWARVPAIRHAMSKFPSSTFIWFLHQDALIMNPQLTIQKHIMSPGRLEDLMIKDQSIVPPDSVIKTYSHLKGTDVDMVLTQDYEGLSEDSLIIRNGAWSRFFLDTWFDPLYRSYNFQRAETHALEHIVQWHPTILSKLALVPQRTMNAYSQNAKDSGLYKDGDFIVRFAGCEGMGRDCATEANPFMKQWRTTFNAHR